MDRYAVLVFHNQNITDDQQMEFTQNFGEIENAKGGNITKDNEYRLKKGMAPAFAQDVKVKIGSDRGHHNGWRHGTTKKVVIHRDRGNHYGWRHRDASIKKKVIIKHDGGSKTVIKKRIEG